MRLQSAIFSLDDALLTPDGAAREGAAKVLSILKMEGVWMYAVSARSRAEAESALARCGLSQLFRGVLASEDAEGKGATLLEKAAHRLRSLPRDTAVFSGSEALLREAAEAGFRTVAVRGGADEERWAAMTALSGETIERYEELLD